MKKRTSIMADFLADLKMSRRRFLKASAVAGTAIAAGPGLPLELNSLALAKGSGTNQGTWLPATCQGCTSWCSKQIYVVDGRAVKVRGNPNSKVDLPGLRPADLSPVAK